MHSWGGKGVVNEIAVLNRYVYKHLCSSTTSQDYIGEVLYKLLNTLYFFLFNPHVNIPTCFSSTTECKLIFQAESRTKGDDDLIKFFSHIFFFASLPGSEIERK